MMSAPKTEPQEKSVESDACKSLLLKTSVAYVRPRCDIPCAILCTMTHTVATETEASLTLSRVKSFLVWPNSLQLKQRTFHVRASMSLVRTAVSLLRVHAFSFCKVFEIHGFLVSLLSRPFLGGSANEMYLYESNKSSCGYVGFYQL